jgi:hypothetical protein
MLLDLLWPLVVVVFFATVFVLLMEFVGYAVRDHDMAISGATGDLASTPTGSQAPA